MGGLSFHRNIRGSRPKSHPLLIVQERRRFPIEGRRKGSILLFGIIHFSKPEPAPTFPLKNKQKREERNYAHDPLPVLKFLPLTKTERIQKAPPSPNPKGEKIYKNYL